MRRLAWLLTITAVLSACAAPSRDRGAAAPASGSVAVETPSPDQAAPSVVETQPAMPAEAAPTDQPAPSAGTVAVGPPLRIAPFGAPWRPSAPIVPAAAPAPPPDLITPDQGPEPRLEAAAPANATAGLDADDIRVVQETLQSQGFYRGPLDGVFNAETRDAVARYQRRHGLDETAALDRETLARLDADQVDYGASGAPARDAAPGR